MEHIIEDKELMNKLFTNKDKLIKIIDDLLQKSRLSDNEKIYSDAYSHYMQRFMRVQWTKVHLNKKQIKLRIGGIKNEQSNFNRNCR